jgi:hypothetical protein
MNIVDRNEDINRSLIAENLQIIFTANLEVKVRR